MNGACSCGKTHTSSVRRVISEIGAIEKTAEQIKYLGASCPFVLADANTYRAAGERVEQNLLANGMKPHTYVLSGDCIEPNEAGIGAAVLHYPAACDVIVAVGSGVVNDIGKIISQMAQKPYIIVATAPSMDGYASASSSVIRDGLKISLATRCPDVIIGDIDVLRAAPMRMLQAGLGDMLAKYISICEWRIAALVVGEYYCEAVADLVRKALQKCVQNANGLLKREADAVQAVFDGLVMGGMAMEYAGMSRPASGVEHYISHVWDMRGQAFGSPTDLHGIQCAVGTLTAARVYEQIVRHKPNRARALCAMQRFDVGAWHRELSAFVGSSAEAMIELEKKEQKYSAASHRKRLDKIIENWDAIVCIIREEIPPSSEIERILDQIGAPKSCTAIGIDAATLPMTFAATKDIRDKYIASRLCMDLGITEDICLQ